MYHKTVSKIINLLNENNCWYKTFEHAPVKTSEEAAKVRTGYSMKNGAKAMIVTIGKDMFIMLVVPGDQRFDNKKVKNYLKCKDLRFASENDIERITEGVLIGGVPPFGNIFGLRILADPKIFSNAEIVFNAGDRSFSIAMKSNDYKAIVKPEVVDITHSE